MSQNQVDPSPFPLRKTVVIAAVVWINSFSTLVTAPFLPFMVQSMLPELEKDQIGLRSGFVEACYQVGQAFASYLWGSFSDVHGRRPALLMGLLGTAVSTVAFGMSKQFLTLCFIRFVWGALNGNMGVSKSALSEILPQQHQPRGFGFIGVAAGFGRLLGPAVGGVLARPAESGIAALDTAFFREYPYILPCLVSSAVTSATLVACYFLIEETLEGAREGWWNRRMRSPRGCCSAGGGSDNSGSGCNFEYVCPCGGVRQGGGQSYRRVGEKGEAESRTVTQQGPSTELELPEIAASDDESGFEWRGEARAMSPIESEPEDRLADEKGAIRHQLTATQLAAASPATNDDDDTISPSAAAPRLDSDSAGDEDSLAAEAAAVGACQLLRRQRVLAPAMLYCGLAFVALAGNEALPLQALNDADHGGFGFRARDIGMCITMVGPVLLVFQMFLYSRVVDALGLLGSTQVALLCFCGTLVATPWLGLLAPYPSWVHWVGLMVIITATAVSRVTAFINTFQLVANATSSPAERGKVNGIAQSFAAAGRVVAPPFGTMVFAYFAGLNRGWPLNWHAVWIMLALAALGVLGVARTVPEENERAYMEGKRGGDGGDGGADGIDGSSDGDSEPGGLVLREGHGGLDSDLDSDGGRELVLREERGESGSGSALELRGLVERGRESDHGYSS